MALIAGMLSIVGVVAVASSAQAAGLPLSTVTKAGTNVANGSTASSSGTTGTAKPGDKINWVVNYTNDTTADAAVNITDPITAGQTYVNGSLVVPPALAPQFSTNGGASWNNGIPVAGSTGVGATGTLSPGAVDKSASFNSSTLKFNTPGGDGWDVSGFGSNIYSVFHHDTSTTSVFCATLANAVCPGWPGFSTHVSTTVGAPIGTGAVVNSTSVEPGSFIVNGKLFWAAEDTSNPAAGATHAVGIQCLDLTTLLSCGFTVLDTVTGTAVGSTDGTWPAINGDGIAAPNGNYYYLDTAGKQLCFSPATATSCGTTPVTGGIAVPDFNVFNTNANEATFGQYIFTSYLNNPIGTQSLTCFNTATNALCTGYPKVPTGASQGGFAASEVAPVLSTTGAVLGACIVSNALCFDTSGNPIANPYAATTVGQYLIVSGQIVGTKFYTGTTTNSVGCFDFATWTGVGTVPSCTGFANVTDASDYTARTLANLPGCMAANGDGAQIVIFNQATGGPCVTGSSTMTMTAPSYCDGQDHTGAWSTLTLNGLTGVEYGAAVVTISGSSGPVPGFTNLQFSAGQTSVDISSIPMSGTTAELTASVNFTGVTNQPAVDAATFSLHRSGDTYSQMCYSTTVNPIACLTSTTVTDNANATTTHGATTDSPLGNSSGATSFTVTPTAAQCTLAFNKTASSQNAKPGDTVTYTIAVTNNGTMDYTAGSPATFTDSLATVLPDANYNNDAAATAGTATYTAPTLSWSGPLAAGATATITYSVTVKSPDSGPHKLANTVVSTDPSNCATGSGAPACTASLPISDLTIVKSVLPTMVTAAGQSVTYSFLVTNTGQTTLTNIAVADVQTAPAGALASGPTCPLATLAAGASETCTATYTASQADVDKGRIDDSAKASGKDPSGKTVTSVPSTATVTATPNPAVTLLKTVTPTTLTAAGQSVTYSFLVTNTGNVTLANVAVTDTAFSGTGTAPVITCPAGAASLAPVASVTCTATYVATQADVDAGQITNTATATGTPPTGPKPVSPPSTAVVTITPTPAITVVKSANPSDAAHFTLGQVITYTFLITNTGNVTLKNVTPIEGAFSGTGSMSAPTCPGGAASLAPAAQVACTATYTITQLDVDAGQLTNAVTATGTPPTGPKPVSPPSSVTIPSNPAPAISLVKSATPATITAAGQTVTYSFVVTNTGNVTLTNATATDTAFSGTGTPPVISCPAGAASLVPGATVTCTATYVPTQADVDAGQITNTATATGTPPPGVTPPVSPPSTAIVTATQTAAITLVKSALPTTITAAGQSVAYSFLVTNTGNVSLTNPVVTDSAFTGTGTAPTIVCPAVKLAPGGTTTCSATYVATQADINAGSITNTATATGTPPTGVTPPVSPPSTAIVTTTPSPAITLAKTATPTTLTAVGQSVTYNFLVTNSGNVTLTNVTVADSAFSGTGTPPTITCPAGAASLAPGASVTCTATYVATQSDADAGTISNTATATGTPPTGPKPVSPPSTAVVTITPTPAISVVKSANPSDTAHFTVGRLITYSFLITNTGNVTLKNVVPVEGAFTGSGGMSAPTCPAGAASLAPGASVTCTATYTLTQADVDAGTVTNAVTATGTPPTGPKVVSPPSSVTIPGDRTASVTLVKSASPSTITKAGQTVTYSFLVTNTGNVSLKNPVVTDKAFSGTGVKPVIVCPAVTLLPGGTTTCSATYVPTQADVDAGQITNTATVTGTPPPGVTPPVSPPSTAVVTVTQNPAIVVVKSASPADTAHFTVGQKITYSFLITNTGNVTLTNVAPIEGTFTGSGKLSAPVCPAAAASVAPGVSVTCTASYTVTQADVDAGKITNDVTATGTPPTGPKVVSPLSKVVIPGKSSPALTVVKTASRSVITGPGQQIAYSFVVTNTGNVTLTNVTVTDSGFTGTGTLSAVTCPAAVLSPGAHITCIATYTTTQADVDAGKLTNTATATGTPPGGGKVNSPPSKVTITSAKLGLAKSATAIDVNADGRIDAGDQIAWTLVVTNLGSVTISDILVSDPMAGTVSCPKTTLAAGESMTCTAPNHTITDADAAAGSVENTAVASGNGVTGSGETAPVESNPAQAIVPVQPEPGTPLPPLAFTGVAALPQLLGTAALLLLLGGAALIVARRRRRI